MKSRFGEPGGERPGAPDAVAATEVAADAARGPADADAAINVSGYRFVPIADPEAMRARLAPALAGCGVRGTVLIAPEGVNVALAGTGAGVAGARRALAAEPALAGLRLKESRSAAPPFARLKVRVKPEIIGFDGVGRPGAPRAPAVPPATLARWLGGERHEVRLLDTRNAYEVAAGAFDGALSLDIDHFRDFTAAVDAALADGTLDPAVPLVTYCTGGVRCEKAAPWLIERGFREVWQLDGGILDWFAERGGEAWTGDCFVFDDRVSVDPALAPSGATPCAGCGTAVRPGTGCTCGQAPGGAGPATA